MGPRIPPSIKNSSTQLNPQAPKAESPEVLLTLSGTRGQSTRQENKRNADSRRHHLLNLEQARSAQTFLVFTGEAAEGLKSEEF